MGPLRAVLVISTLALPLTASAAGGVRVVISRDVERTLFPSDQFAVLDFTQNTFERIHLPRPDCHAQPVACEDCTHGPSSDAERQVWRSEETAMPQRSS